MKENLKTNNNPVRRLGLFATILTCVGVILGAGIYVLIGVAVKQAGFDK
jgi:hypothetical protein